MAGLGDFLVDDAIELFFDEKMVVAVEDDVHAVFHES
jgi:hypothetical protein